VFLALLPLYGLGMLVAVVRGAWLGTAVGLLWLGIRRHRILLLGIPVALLVLALGPSTSGSNATSSASGEARVQTWQDNLYQVGDHPFGIGVGTIGAAAQRLNVLRGGNRGYTFEGIGGNSAYQPDNQYFLYTLELGLIGLWCFVLFLAAAFRTAMKASERTGGEDSAFALGTAAVIVAYAVAGLVATILEIAPTVYFFWLLLGTTSALAPDRKRGRVPAVALRPVPARGADRRPVGAEAT
jgi:O-antigen ligase